MTLFEAPKDGVIVTPLTDIQKRFIYDELKLKTPYNEIKQSVNHVNGASFAYQLDNELSKFESQVNNYMAGRVLISSAEYDDEGVISKEAVYNIKPATLISLKALDYSLGVLDGVKTSDEMVDEVVVYATKEGTWTAFKEQ